MAGFFHARQAGDLAVGKPPLHKYPKHLSVGEALKALKTTDDADLSLWEELCPLTEKPIREAQANARETASHGDASACVQGSKESLWRCVGKIGMVDIICFLASDDSLVDQVAALRTPVSSIVSDTAFAIQHVDSRSKLIDALAHVLDGAHHLVVSIDRTISSRLARYNSLPKPRRGAAINKTYSLPPAHGVHQEYCWLTPEDLLQFLLSCIGLFSPLPMMTIQQLGIIRMDDVLTVTPDADATTAVPLIRRAARDMTAVAVVQVDHTTQELKLVGEVSPFTMKSCDEKAALALATLSVREFLAFSRDSDSMVQLVETRLSAKMEALPMTPREALLSDSDSPVCFPSPLNSSLAAMYSLDSGEESSSDEDGYATTTNHSPRSHAHLRLAPNVCRPWSSLVAVMAQALTHRVGYIWVTDDENSLLGIVTYLDIIHCILGHLYSSD